MTSNNTRFMDLFNRALSLGYDRGAAAAVADVFDTVHTYDPCKLHPALSTTMDRQGYLADGCEACYVIRRTDAAGYVPGGFCADGKCGTCADCVECAEVEASDPEACKKHKGGYNIPGVAVCVGCEADGTHGMEGPTGLEILADLIELETVSPSAERDRMVKFHKLSAPMIGVITIVARSRGLVGAWAMRNVVLAEVPGATRRTLDALIKRGILADEINEGNASGTGGLHDYLFTDRGAEVAEILGCPVQDLPTDPAAAEAFVAGKAVEDCETGCEAILARGVVMLAHGGEVCLGCGSIFTRPNGQLHPGLYVVSEAVSARNAKSGV